MTQFSRPQAGLFPADGDDCGAYTANEWAAMFMAANRSGGMVVTGAASPPGLPATAIDPNIGVYYRYLDRLVVTSPGVAQISIAVGAAIVDGRVYTNDTAIAATPIIGPAANPRIDRVVIRQNYTAVDYTSVNAPALIVDLNTARIAIISGAEAVGPAAPTLTQDEDRATYWDIPLYQYQIAVGGAITGLTDEREWADVSAFEKIDETVLTAPANIITFASIPQVYRHLQIVGHGQASAATPNVWIRFNADAAANYDNITSRESHANTLLTAEQIATNQIQIPEITSVANTASGFVIHIPNYRGIFHKSVNAMWDNKIANTTGNLRTNQSSSWWRSVAAITNITMEVAGAPTWNTGTVVTLYGLL